MTEYIQNGDFLAGFDYWNNGVIPGNSYILDGGKILGESNLSTEQLLYSIDQEFSVNDQVIIGKISVWAKWDCYPGVMDGYCRFVVKLKKPSAPWTTIINCLKQGESGEGYILNEDDILGLLDQQGNYRLKLDLYVAGALIQIEPSEQYEKSKGWFDNISLEIAVKKYKTVIEHIGGDGSLMIDGLYHESADEQIKLSEAKNFLLKCVKTGKIGLAEFFEITSGFNKQVKESIALKEFFGILVKYSILEKIGLNEFYSITSGFTKNVLEYFGLLESKTVKTSTSKSEIVKLTENYEAHKRYPKSSLENINFIETISAKRIAGNVITYFNELTPISWQETSKVSTQWIKKKIEIR